MTYELACRPLFRTILTAGVLLAGCARSAIEELEEDGSFSIADTGEEPDADAEPGDEPTDEEDAGAPPEVDAGDAPSEGDAGGLAQDAAQDAAAMDGAATEAGAEDAGGAADAALDAADAALDAAVPDAAADAAPVDAAPPADTAPPAPKCTAGNYRGVFMGAVVVELFGFELTTIQLTGTVTLTAVAEAGTERFAVSNGAVNGQDDSGNPITAKVEGSLNCATGKLDDGKLSDGRYVHFLIGEILFTGSVTGTYTNRPPYAEGAWQTETASTNLLRSGMGTWNVSLVP